MPEKNYLDEIEEILKRSEKKPPSSRPQWAFKLSHKLPRLRVPRPSWMPTISAGRLMIAGIALLILAMIFRALVPGLMAPLIWAGLGLFVLAYLFFLIKPSQPRYEKRWRGQSIEEEPESPWDRIRRLFKGK